MRTRSDLIPYLIAFPPPPSSFFLSRFTSPTRFLLCAESIFDVRSFAARFVPPIGPNRPPSARERREQRPGDATLMLARVKYPRQRRAALRDRRHGRASTGRSVLSVARDRKRDGAGQGVVVPSRVIINGS